MIISYERLHLLKREIKRHPYLFTLSFERYNPLNGVVPREALIVLHTHTQDIQTAEEAKALPTL